MENNVDELSREEARLRQELQQCQQEQRKERRDEIARTTFDEVFAGRDIYYVLALDKIFEYNRQWSDSPWTFYDCRAFRNEHATLRDNDGWASLMVWLKRNGRYFKRATYSFKAQPDTVLNFMRTDHWLRPEDGEPNRWYETLLLALGGGNQEGKDHIEQVLVWKYLHPDDFLLPCVNWFDEGGVGKNLFVDGLLGAIFGREQVCSVGLDHLTGQFNSVIKGKTVVLMNEAANRKVDMEKFKNMVGQPDVMINEKKIPQYRVDNTPLYFIATNDPMSIPVEGKQSDRRWSLIHLRRSIYSFVAEELNCSELDAKRLWEDQFADELKDPANLRVWLSHILAKWQNIRRPSPLHGADYEHAVALRKELNPINQALELLESMDTWIPVQDLFLESIGATTLNRGTMWGDFIRFGAELSNEVARRKLPLVYELKKKHHCRPDSFGRSKPANAAIIRAESYQGPFTKNHHDCSSDSATTRPAVRPVQMEGVHGDQRDRDSPQVK